MIFALGSVLPMEEQSKSWNLLSATARYNVAETRGVRGQRGRHGRADVRVQGNNDSEGVSARDMGEERRTVCPCTTKATLDAYMGVHGCRGDIADSLRFHCDGGGFDNIR